MPSHTEYIDDQDAEQLAHLIEVATQRRDDLIHGGWTRVWLVADFCNKGWFPLHHYTEAVDFLSLLGKVHAKAGEHHELRLSECRLRPAEVEQLYAETAKEAARLANSLA